MLQCKKVTGGIHLKSGMQSGSQLYKCSRLLVYWIVFGQLSSTELQFGGRMHCLHTEGLLASPGRVGNDSPA